MLRGADQRLNGAEAGRETIGAARYSVLGMCRPKEFTLTVKPGSIGTCHSAGVLPRGGYRGPTG
jgi:hypothetical protein